MPCPRLLPPLLMIALGVTGCGGTPSRTAERPNIVVIFTDDQGYADVGCFGAEGYATPHLDRMAAEGLRLTDFHVSQAVCSASRASLLTGCYAERVSIQGALGPQSRVGLNPDEVTLAELLGPLGYATGAFGKWHLGHHREFLPRQQGFDEFFGLPYSNDMWAVDHDGTPQDDGRGHKSAYPALRLIDGDDPGEPVATLADQARLTARYTERAVDFIGRHADEPFFLYLAHSMPHVPLGRPLAFADAAETPYGAVIAEIDDSVGQLLAALDEHGLTNDTLVLFTSDNGPWLVYGDHAGSAAPWREGKGTAWEGGARVPAIVRWPGRVPAGSRCDRLAATVDLLPTLAEICGAALPERPIDGVSLLPLLTDPAGPAVRREYAYYYGGTLVAVRRDRWKLVFPHTYRSMDGGTPGVEGHPGRYAQRQAGLALYDLDADVGETTDRAAEQPDVMAELRALADALRADLGDRRTGVAGSGIREPGRLAPTRPSPVEHIARGRDVRLSAPPAPRYTGAGAAGLTDGLLGSEDFLDGRWLGYQGEDVELLVDLGAPTHVSHLEASFLQAQNAWIFLPRAVAFAVSTDGTVYTPVGRVEHAVEAVPGVEAHGLAVDMDPREVRFVRVSVTGVGRCPDWHPGRGGGAWTFVDEIVVE